MQPGDLLGHENTIATHTVVAEGTTAVLYNVVVGSSAASAVVTVRFADDDEVISVIDGTVENDYSFNIDLDARGLEVVIAGGAADVTVIGLLT